MFLVSLTGCDSKRDGSLLFWQRCSHGLGKYVLLLCRLSNLKQSCRKYTWNSGCCSGGWALIVDPKIYKKNPFVKTASQRSTHYWLLKQRVILFIWLGYLGFIYSQLVLCQLILFTSCVLFSLENVSEICHMLMYCNIKNMALANHPMKVFCLFVTRTWESSGKNGPMIRSTYMYAV